MRRNQTLSQRAQTSVTAPRSCVSDGIVPDVRARVAVRLEDEQREERRGPDRGACPEEDLGRGVSGARQPQLAACRPLRRAHALTGGHDARSYSDGGAPLHAGGGERAARAGAAARRVARRRTGAPSTRRGRPARAARPADRGKRRRLRPAGAERARRAARSGRPRRSRVRRGDPGARRAGQGPRPRARRLPGPARRRGGPALLAASARTRSPTGTASRRASRAGSRSTARTRRLPMPYWERWLDRSAAVVLVDADRRASSSTAAWRGASCRRRRRRATASCAAAVITAIIFVGVLSALLVIPQVRAVAGGDPRLLGACSASSSASPRSGRSGTSSPGS